MIQLIERTCFTFLTELVQLTASFAIQLDELKDNFLNLVQENQVCAFKVSYNTDGRESNLDHCGPLCLRLPLRQKRQGHYSLFFNDWSLFTADSYE